MMRHIIFLFGIIATNLFPQFSKAQCPVFDPAGSPPIMIDCSMLYVTLFPNLTNASGNFTYSWTCPPGATTTAMNSSTLNTNAPGIYTIIVTNTVSLCSANATMEVIKAQITAKCSAYSFTNSPMTVHFSNLSNSSLGSASISTQWNFGNSQTANTANTAVSPSVTYASAGSYTVTIIANKGICTATFAMVVFPGLANQAWVGIDEQFIFPGEEVTRYFDLNGVEQGLERNKVLIEQIGIKRRKIIQFE